MLNRIIVIILALLFTSPAWADGTINTLSAGTALAGTELLPIYQGANPAVTTTPSAFGTYLSGFAFPKIGITSPAANSTALTISGTSHTGSDATPDISISGTWNTTGAISGIFENMTCTSCANSWLENLQIGGVQQFGVLSNGVIYTNNDGIILPFNAGIGVGRPDAGAGLGEIYIGSAFDPAWTITVGNGGVIGFSSLATFNSYEFPDTMFSRFGAADMHLGTGDAAAPVPQTFGVQSVVAGTSNTAGALWTHTDSAGTGTGSSGGYQWQTAAPGSTGTSQNAEADTMDLTYQGLTLKQPFRFTSLAVSPTAPTIASGGCTSPSVPHANGTAAFQLTIGTSCTGVSTIVLTMPTAANGWSCSAHDITSNATNAVDESAQSATSVTLTSYSRTAGTALAWTAGDVVVGNCMAF
jgi:hypothetical protein